MFCDTKIRGNYKTSNQLEAAITLLDYDKPIYARGCHRLIGFEKEIENLRFRFYTDTLTVTCNNSIHKFQKGTNSGLLTRQDIFEAVNRISEYAQIPVEKLYFYYTETAVNLAGLNYDTSKYLEQPISYKGKLFLDFPPPRGFNRVLERYCPLTQQRIKFYNQRAWIKYKQNFDIGIDQLRYELVFEKCRPLQYILQQKYLPVTLLYSKPVLKRFGEHLLNTYKIIDKKPFVDYSGFKPLEIELLCAGETSGYWEAMKSHPESRRKKRNDYLKLKKQCGNHDELSIEIEAKIKEQIELILET